MGDIEKEEYGGPKVYASLDECWEDLVNKENIKDVFPDPLRPRETLIFMLGVIAGQRQERGEWFIEGERTENVLKVNRKEKDA